MGYRESIKIVANELPINKGTFLITGASGLIGSTFIDVLLYANENLEANFKIYALGRSKKRITERFGCKVTQIIQDITQPLDSFQEFDYILHAASNADPKTYFLQPVETVLTNIMGNKNVLDYCKKHKNTRLLQTSTFEVYGKIAGVDIYSEGIAGAIDFHILRNCYPESKRCSEILLRSYVEEYRIQAIIARLSSIYGPTMLTNDSKAHAQFIKNAIKKENIVMKTEGIQKRTYCYVVDAVSALFTIMFKGVIGEAYNVANENSIATIADVAQICAKIAGTKVVFSLPDEKEVKGFSEAQNCILDNKKLKELGWNGRFTLYEGMKETINALSYG